MAVLSLSGSIGGQGQEPTASGLQPGDGCVLVASRRAMQQQSYIVLAPECGMVLPVFVNILHGSVPMFRNVVLA